MAIGPRPSSVAAVALLTLGNLRGIREAGTIFAVPTYAFVATMYVLIAVGLYRLFLGGGLTYVPPPSALAAGSESLGIFLLPSAFAQGCTAMTGTEAISDGVLAFEPPEAGNARKTREPGWKRSMIINGMGMVATAIVTLVIASTKFAHGAWLVVLPEYVPSHWWEHALHNQTALRLRAALLFHPGVIVTNVPYHVSRPRPKPV